MTNTPHISARLSRAQVDALNAIAAAVVPDDEIPPKARNHNRWVYMLRMMADYKLDPPQQAEWYRLARWEKEHEENHGED